MAKTYLVISIATGNTLQACTNEIEAEKLKLHLEESFEISARIVPHEVRV